jgi:hypothetical protein
MAPRFGLRGKGYTKVPVPIFGDDWVAALKYEKRRSTFEGWVALAEQEARTGLLKAGHSEEALANLKDLRTISRDAEPDSNEDFHARILGPLQRVRAAIKDGNADRAARYALDLGATIQLHVVRNAQREDAARGGRKPDNRRNVALAREFQLRREASKRSATALKAQIGAERGLSRSTSIDAINAGLKILSGKRAIPND